jgi:FdhE protein
LSRLTRDVWLESHAYLRPVGELCARIERAAAGLGAETAPLPDWTAYAGDYREGVSLLRSSAGSIDLEPAGRMTVRLVDALASDSADGRLASEASALTADLRARPDAARLVAKGLLGEPAFDLPSPGLLRYLAWTAASRYLAPAVGAFARWRDEDLWQRRYCSTCGSAPAMAQLVGVDPGRQRFLVCGGCGDRWRYRRTQCPFCEADAQRLSTLTIQGECGLRLDHCESCGGYLKTYDGEGNEALLLADWSSLHLDVLARDRGWKRVASSLYDLPAEAAAV